MLKQAETGKKDGLDLITLKLIEKNGGPNALFHLWSASGQLQPSTAKGLHQVRGILLINAPSPAN